MEKTLLRISNSLVDALVLMCLVIVFAYSAYALWDVNTIYQHAEASNFTEYKPSGSSPEARKSFAALQKINPDVLGWLTVYDTAIDYPLVQTEDNFTYLDKTVEGDYSAAGSLFLDYRNQPDFSDWNTIIHGHHMAARAMFGDIALYEEAEYFNQHRYGDLFYGGRHYGLEIFALVLTDTSDSLLFTPAVQGTEAQTAYLQRIQEKARNKSELTIGTDDRILAMATCSGLVTNGRHMLVAKILDEPVPNPFPTPPSQDEILKNRTGMGAVFATNEEGRMTNLLLVLALIFLLCLLAYMVLEFKNKQLDRRRQTATNAAVLQEKMPLRAEGADSRPNHRSQRPLRVLVLCLLSFFMAISITGQGVAAQPNPIRQSAEGAEAVVSFKQRIYAKYYDAEPDPNIYIRYEFLPMEEGSPMPGGKEVNKLLFDLRVGSGDPHNFYELIKKLEPIKVMGNPPQKYHYTLRALLAYGPGSDAMELDDRVYEIILQYVALPAGGSGEDNHKLLMILELPDAKPEEIIFNHTYAGPSKPTPSESETQAKPGETVTPGQTKPQTKQNRTQGSEPVATRPDGTPVPATGEIGLPPWLCLLFLLILASLLGGRYRLEKAKSKVETSAAAATSSEEHED